MCTQGAFTVYEISFGQSYIMPARWLNVHMFVKYCVRYIRTAPLEKRLPVLVNISVQYLGEHIRIAPADVHAYMGP